MAVKLDNRARWIRKAADHDWYEWEVFVDEDPGKLEEIVRVVYFLHSTFPDPVRTVTDRDRGFSLRARGWGEFEIRAQVAFRDGSTETVRHWLDLSRPWPG
jgi:transcription initiation factor IIF auxiliary subunit